MEVYIEMQRLPFAIACTPFCICATIVNVFFIFCLCKPPVGVSIHQPMHLLLCALLGNSTVQQLIAMISVVLCFLTPPSWLLVLNAALIFQTYCAGFSINSWISIFYYMKIVPQHWKLFIWYKKNVKTIVFVGFVLDQVLLLSALSIGTASYLVPSSSDSLNETLITEKTVVNGPLYVVSTRLFMGYLICPIFTLSISWGKTFLYLRKHIKRMKETTGSSAHLQQKNHMRVTVIGIIQTALFIPSSLFAMLMAVLLTTFYETMDNNKHIMMTFTSISNLANILCLGFSQSVFRIRVIALLKRLKKAFGSGDQK